MKVSNILLNLANLVKRIKQLEYKLGLIDDFVVDHGIGVTTADGSIWEYFKYESGLVDMWGYRSVANISPYTTFSFGNNIYAYCRQTTMTYPFTLTSVPLVMPNNTIASAFTMSTVVDSEIYVDYVKMFGFDWHIGTAGSGGERFVARCHLIGTWK
jgi:hypothetical protein